MPKIPTYDSPQVAARPLPDAQQDNSIATPRSVGLFDAPGQEQMRTGAALARGGNELADVAVQMQNRQNADSVFRAETAIKNDYLDYQQQAQQRRGQDAWNLTNDTRDWWDKQIATHADNLDNDVQRQTFARSAAEWRLQSLGAMSHFESEQRQQSLDASTVASNTGSINFASANANQWGAPTPDGSPDPIAKARQDIIDHLRVAASRNGWTSDMLAAKEAETLTTLHTQVIQNLADTDLNKAKAYYAANKGEINGSQQDVIDKLLKAGSNKELAQTTAADLTRQGMNEADGLTWIRGNLKGEDQEQAAIEWRTRWQEQEVAGKRQQDVAGDQAWRAYNQRGRLSDVPATVVNSMDPKAWAALKDHAETKAKGQEVKTDFPTWYGVQKQILGGQPVNLLQYVNRIGTSDLKGLADLQSKPPAALKEAQTVDSQIAATLKPLNMSEPDYAQANNSIRGMLDAETQATGKTLNATDRQKVIDRAVMQGDVQKGYGWFNPTERVYQVTPVDRAQFRANIPQGQADQIIEALRARGKPITDDSIIDLYNSTKRRGSIK